MGISSASLVREAITYLRTYGWYQGHYVDPDAVQRGIPRNEAPRCAYGAMNYICKTQTFPPGFRDKFEWGSNLALDQAMQEIGFPGEFFAWQDVPGRTLDEVVERLERVSRILEMMEGVPEYAPSLELVGVPG